LYQTDDFGASWTSKDPVIARRIGNESIEASIDRRIVDLATTVTSSGKARVYAATGGRFWDWGILGGDWGKTLFGSRSVWSDLSRAFPPTLQLMIMTVVVSTAVATPIGIMSAVRQDTVADYLGRFIAIFGLAVPAFWLATLILVFPAIWFDFSPPLEYVGFWENPAKNLTFFALPVCVAGIFGSASVMRMTRSMMLEVLRQDYIRTAWSKGLRERVIISRHALKNAMIPVLTIVGMQIPFLLGNQVVIERIFNIPGLGRILLEGTSTRDYTLVQGIVFFLSFFIIASNLVVDLAYGWLDPRIRYE
jgi:peptide/nickel transport system permease protein